MATKTKIYVISLRQAETRRKYIQDHLDSLNLDYEVIDAVYGKALTSEEIANVYDEKKAVTVFGRPLSMGEIGCGLSHISIWKKIAEEGLEHALILEDDILLNSEIYGLIEYVATCNLNWDIILLSGSNAPRINIKNNICGSLKLSYCTGITTITAAYFIRRRAAEKLLSETLKLYKPIDHYTGDPKSNGMHVLRVDPIFDQNPAFHEFTGSSTLAEDRTNRENVLKRTKYGLHKYLAFNPKGKRLLDFYYLIKNNISIFSNLAFYKSRKKDLFGCQDE